MSQSYITILWYILSSYLLAEYPSHDCDNGIFSAMQGKMTITELRKDVNGLIKFFKYGLNGEDLLL